MAEFVEPNDLNEDNDPPLPTIACPDGPATDVFADTPGSMYFDWRLEVVEPVDVDLPRLFEAILKSQETSYSKCTKTYM